MGPDAGIVKVMNAAAGDSYGLGDSTSVLDPYPDAAKLGCILVPDRRIANGPWSARTVEDANDEVVGARAVGCASNSINS